jgi:hypothetical protein
MDQPHLRRTVLYVSADGRRRRTYPIVLGGDPAPTITTRDGTVLHLTMVMTAPHAAIADDVETFEHFVTAVRLRHEHDRARREAA